MSVRDGDPTRRRGVAGSEATDNPDLLGIGVDSARDQVAYTFDEFVTIVPTVSGTEVTNRFRLYNGDGSEVTSQTARKDGDNVVIATFSSGAVTTNAAGASADARAVEGSGRRPNAVDEQGLTRSFAAEQTDAPDLQTIARARTGSGNDEVVRLTYDFDAPVVTTSVTGGDLSGDFFVYQANGARTQLPDGSCTVPSTDNTQVVCSIGATAGTFAAAREAVLATAAFDAVRDPVRSLFNYESGRALR